MKCARFTAPARREFLAQVAYFEMKEPGLGARFSDAVEQTTARALALPFASAPASKNARRVFVRHFPFSVVYRPEPDGGILIVAIAHHSRRPEYWHLRVQDVAPPAEHEVRPSGALHARAIALEM